MDTGRENAVERTGLENGADRAQLLRGHRPPLRTSPSRGEGRAQERRPTGPLATYAEAEASEGVGWVLAAIVRT